MKEFMKKYKMLLMALMGIIVTVPTVYAAVVHVHTIKLNADKGPPALVIAQKAFQLASNNRANLLFDLILKARAACADGQQYACEEAKRLQAEYDKLTKG